MGRPRLLQPLDYAECHPTATPRVARALPRAVGALHALVQAAVTRRARKHSRGRVRQSCTCHCRSRRQEMKRQTWFSFNNVIQSPLLMPKVAILRFPQMRIRFLLETGFLARLPAWRAAPPDYSRPVSSCW